MAGLRAFAVSSQVSSKEAKSGTDSEDVAALLLIDIVVFLIVLRTEGLNSKTCSSNCLLLRCPRV